MGNVGGVEVTPNLLLFGGIASLAALAAVGVVLFNNTIRSALCLVVVFFSLAVIYFGLNAEMLGITQIVVYLGAIMVLVLFVIMLLNLGSPQTLIEKTDPKLYLGLLFGLALFGLVASQIAPPLLPYVHIGALDNYGSPEAIGRTLFTQYVFPFEIASILLLVGVVGSILLAKRRVS
jgi:NADH-quinone oxidoreductase subunit J